MKRFITLAMSMTLTIVSVFAQTRNISGTILSSEDNEPLIGAIVVIDGVSGFNALSDLDGHFNFTGVPQGEFTVTVSMMGMQTVQQKLENNMTVIMHPDSKYLDEVMVVAYGAVKKASYAGSAVQVTSKSIEDLPMSNFENALSGKVSGVVITNASGQAGSAPSIRVRGNGSMNASSEPLYVIDGVPVVSGNLGQMSDYIAGASNSAMASLNSNDIESISILKDAAASSLYGSRAANGVVIITTKQGRKGRPVVSFNASLGLTPSWATDNYELADPQAQADMLFEIFYDSKYSADKQNGAEAVEYSLKQLNNKFNQFGYNFEADKEGDRYQHVQISDYENSGRAGKYYDWDKALFRTAVYKNYDFSVSGGSDNSSYFSSISYTSEEGRVRVNDFDRFSGRVNLNQRVGRFLDFATSVSISRTSQSGFNDTRNTGQNYFMQSRNLFLPFYWPTLPDGTEFTGRYASYAYNPNYYNNEWENSTVRLRLNASESVTLHLFNGLDIKSIFSYEDTNVSDHVYFSANHFNGSSSNGVVNEMRTDYSKIVSSNTVNYSRSFAKNHRIALLGGFEAESNNSDFVRATGKNLPSSNLHTVVTAGSLESNGYSWGNSMMSFLSKADYSFAERYFLSASFRRDGSSKLSPDTRWGNFWSVSGAWRIIEEPFMQNIPAVTDLKLRASYGVNGTLPSGNYSYMNLISYSYKYLGEPGGVINSIGNEDLTWETSYNSNIGVDFSLFSRVHGTVEYFNRDSRNLLQDVPISSATGFSSVLQNVGEINNRGIDFELSAEVIRTRNLKWTLGLNTSFLKSRVTKLYDGQDIIWNDPTGGDARAKFIYREGESTRAFYGYEYAGVDPENGRSVYYANNDELDADNLPSDYFIFNGRIASYNYNKVENVIIGDAIPFLQGGFNSNLDFHGFDLGLNFIYKIGGDLYDGAEKDVADDGYYWNRTRSQYFYENRWTENNTSGTIQKLTGDDREDAMQKSSRHLYDASFLRLKSATLGYTLPKSVAKAVHVSSARVYVTGTNLLTFAAYKHADPEVGVYGTRGWETPIGKTYTCGVSLKF